MAREFELIDVAVAIGVGIAHEAVPNVAGKRQSPHNWHTVRLAKHAAHAGAGRVVCSLCGGIWRQDLEQVRGPRSDRGEQASPIVKFVVHSGRQRYTADVLKQCKLQVTEQAHAAWDYFNNAP